MFAVPAIIMSDGVVPEWPTRPKLPDEMDDDGESAYSWNATLVLYHAVSQHY